jgi:uncharacterized protein YbbK (DUF523 family)
MTDDPRPANSEATPLRIGVSACLLGQQVRYDGGHRRHDFVVEQLAKHAELIPVCPEVELGLGTPREKIQLVKLDPEVRLVAAESQRDLTEAMNRYAERRVAELERLQLCGFVLKQGSPSCGIDSVRTVEGDVETRQGRGLFAAKLIGKLPWLPVIDEAGLCDCDLRYRFLVAVFETYGKRLNHEACVPEELLKPARSAS